MKVQEFIAEWVQDLQSGQYTQARETLYDPAMGGYCCLGVACLTAERLGLKVRDGWREEVERGFHFNTLKGEPIETFGNMGYNPIVEGISCTNMNDDEEMTFYGIAERLKEKFLSP